MEDRTSGWFGSSGLRVTALGLRRKSSALALPVTTQHHQPATGTLRGRISPQPRRVSPHRSTGSVHHSLYRVSSLSQHLSISPSKSPSHVTLSVSRSLSLVEKKEESRRKEERREKKKRREVGGLCVNLRKKGKWDGLHVRLGEKGLTGLGFCPFFSFLFKTPIFSKL
jgi:hypothetical protein